LAENVGGEDERSLTQGENQTADDPGGAGPAQGGKDDNDQKKGGIGRKAGGKRSTEGEEKIKAGHSHEELGEPHGERVGPTTQITGEATDGEAEQAGQKNPDQADAKRDAGTVKEPREDVTAGGIAPQEIDNGGGFDGEEVGLGREKTK
jgi:hypothetical protein